MDRGIIHSESMHVYGSYDSVNKAKSVLKNAQTKGWKIQGRMPNHWIVQDLIVSTLREFQELDVIVEVMSLNAYGGEPTPVKIRKSERGGPCDPSTERYWCM